MSEYNVLGRKTPYVILKSVRQPKDVYNARYRASFKGKLAQRRARTRYKQKRSIRYDYPISKDARERMYASQDGLCGLCLKPMPFAESHLDHNHETGKLRALVHPVCNWLIGWMERYPNLVPLVLPYLQEHKGN